MKMCFQIAKQFVDRNWTLSSPKRTSPPATPVPLVTIIVVKQTFGRSLRGS